MGAEDADLVVVRAVVVGLLLLPPPSEMISGVLVVGWDDFYRYQARIGSSIGSGPCRCILRRRTKSRYNLGRHIVRMLDSGLQRR